MTKHLTLGLAAFTLFSLAGGAKAEMLSLDCSINGSVATNLWVDIGKSTVTVAYPQDTPPIVNTFPGQITVTSISWNSVNGYPSASWSIDRTSGILTTVMPAGITIYPQQCVRGTTPLPATKF